MGVGVIRVFIGWVTSSENGLSHRPNQNNNQNKGGNTEGNGGEAVWPCGIGVLRGLRQFPGGNVPGTQTGANRHPSNDERQNL
jgi:hypothetical protein